MTRYGHFLSLKKGTSQPSKYVCVSVRSHTVVAGSGERRHASVLDGWDAIYHWTDKNGVTASAMFDGSSTGTFWTNIEKATRHGGCTWIFMDGATNTLSLLNFWAMLEDGRIQLTGSDTWNSKQTYGQRKQHRQSYIVIEDPPIVIMCRLRGINGTMKIVDCRNYIGANGLTADGTHTTCIVIAQFVGSMIATLDGRNIGSLQATAASQAMASYRHKHLKEPIYVHTDSNALSVERSAMFGGRCESSRIGSYNRTVHHLDFRSHYPALLLKSRLPTMLLRSKLNPGAYSYAELEQGDMCIADVTVRTDTPCVPYRMYGETVFPVGRFRTSLCTPELLLALRHGQLDQWHSAAWYTGGIALSSFASEWIEIRENARKSSDVNAESWAKMVVNSLHGKFGQRGQRWEDCPDFPAYQPYGTWWEGHGEGEKSYYRSIASNVQRRIDLGEHHESVPSISAWICAIGRCELFYAMEKLPDGELLYCDTDSLWVTDEGLMSLTDAGMVGTGEPGRLRLVKTYPWINIMGIKWYETIDGVVCAGKPRSMKSSMEGKQGYLCSMGASEAVKSGNAPSADTIFRSFQRTTGYKHGRVRSDGTVTPMEICE